MRIHAREAGMAARDVAGREGQNEAAREENRGDEGYRGRGTHR